MNETYERDIKSFENYYLLELKNTIKYCSYQLNPVSSSNRRNKKSCYPCRVYFEMSKIRKLEFIIPNFFVFTLLFENTYATYSATLLMFTKHALALRCLVNILKLRKRKEIIIRKTKTKFEK